MLNGHNQQGEGPSLVVAISGHCENSRRLVGSSGYSYNPQYIQRQTGELQRCAAAGCSWHTLARNIGSRDCGAGPGLVPVTARTPRSGVDPWCSGSGCLAYFHQTQMGNLWSSLNFIAVQWCRVCKSLYTVYNFHLTNGHLPFNHLRNLNASNKYFIATWAK